VQDSLAERGPLLLQNISENKPSELDDQLSELLILLPKIGRFDRSRVGGIKQGLMLLI
jgi:hypothetical protein